MAVWLATFALTVFADLTVAVEVGMVLAALLFIRRVADTTTVAAVTDEYIKDSLHHSMHRLEIPPYVRIFRIHGPFLFGATDKLNVIGDSLDTLPEIVVLRLRNMNAIDGTGLLAFEELADRLHESGRELLLCGARRQPAHLMERADFHRHVGDENICRNIGDAIARADGAALHERLRQRRRADRTRPAHDPAVSRAADPQGRILPGARASRPDPAARSAVGRAASRACRRCSCGSTSISRSCRSSSRGCVRAASSSAGRKARRCSTRWPIRASRTC